MPNMSEMGAFIVFDFESVIGMSFQAYLHGKDKAVWVCFFSLEWKEIHKKR